MKQKSDYDLMVIGAGAAGLSLAAGASQLGLKVALIEGGTMGGDCLNTGCVPSKALLAAAKAAHIPPHYHQIGITIPAPAINVPALRAHVRQSIAAIAPHDSIERFEGLGVTVIKGWAEFINPGQISVSGSILSARHIALATGSRPVIPDIPGLHDFGVLTNETIFDVREIPSHLLILGGGAVGIEMALAHRRLGARVTLIQRGRILPGFEPDHVSILRQSLLDDGIILHEQAELTAVTYGRFILANGIIIDDISHCLVAAGRRPDLSRLHLDKAGIAFNNKGILVNSRLQTSQRRIWAMGDCAAVTFADHTDTLNFTHVAGYHAGIVLRNIAFGLPARTSLKHLPRIIYTDPELAQCGMTEQTARATGDNQIIVLNKGFGDLDRARCEAQTNGAIKVIANRKGHILGVSIIGPHAGELLTPWGLAIQKGLKLSALAGMMVAYPTWSDISRAIASEFYRPKLFSSRTRFLVRFLKHLS